MKMVILVLWKCHIIFHQVAWVSGKVWGHFSKAMTQTITLLIIVYENGHSLKKEQSQGYSFGSLQFLTQMKVETQ